MLDATGPQRPMRSMAGPIGSTKYLALEGGHAVVPSHAGTGFGTTVHAAAAARLARRSAWSACGRLPARLHLRGKRGDLRVREVERRARLFRGA
ncbi:MAG TPA: hypothetical protein VF469_16850 [Kofleriaceae bacterium]